MGWDSEYNGGETLSLLVNIYSVINYSEISGMNLSLFFRDRNVTREKKITEILHQAPRVMMQFPRNYSFL
jgi:hypothetical protein